MKKIFVAILFLHALFSTAQKPGVYNNPVLAGFYPDPSICRVGDDYYLVNSSFSYYPGLPLFHSKDLVSWTQIGSAMDRPEQLDLLGAGVSRGLFAPTIRYHNGTYYIVCTLIDKGGNFVITAKDPAGPWSNPVWLRNVDGIDPSLFFDDSTGKAYVIYNSVAPDNQPHWEGHRTIRMRSFDLQQLQAGSDETILVNGGVDTTKKPVWIEGPHVYRIKGWYYLLCAEGGTAYNHSEVVFRSKAVGGPYVPYEGNPVLTQRQLDTGRRNPVTSTGHADMVQTKEGKWYAVFLGCRPYEGEQYNTGRETFMAPVTWTSDGWPVITKGNEEVKYTYAAPNPKTKTANPFSGNFHYHDDFTSSTLNKRYAFLRTVKEPWLTLAGGKLRLQLRPQTAGGRSNPAFVGFRQSHLRCTATAALTFTAKTEKEKAGLAIFQNEQHYYFLCTSVAEGKPVVQLLQSGGNEEVTLLASVPLPAAAATVYLRWTPNGAVYTAAFSTDNKTWTTLKQVDGKFLSTQTAGGFVGSLFGLYATSSGTESSNTASFDWFDYKGDDAVYRQR